MSTAWQIVGMLVLFLVGLRLSAFFSGSETGFYRLSLPRLGIDAQAGDRVAARLLWFAHRPASFVATTLVGNNIANYLITLAVTGVTVTLFGKSSELAEVLSTLLVAPIVFLFGELIPKNVYYRAPLACMRSQIRVFQIFYALALPLTWPLLMLTRLLERLAGRTNRAQEMLPGRGRFLQMISYGRHEGLLSHAQSTMATSVLVIAAQPVTDSMIPADRVLGLPETADRSEILSFARRFGTPVVAFFDPHRGAEDGQPQWTSYVRVSDLLVSTEPLAELRRTMPTIPDNATKLEALSLLHEQGAMFAAVVDRARKVRGTISQRGLAEQLFRIPGGPRASAGS